MIFETIIGGLLGGGLIGLIEFLIRRRDERNDRSEGIVEKLDEMDKKINALASKGDERDAIHARVRILRFADEMQEGRRHTKDSYDQVMSDITMYNNFCAGHPLFRNHQTEATCEYIKVSYQERLAKRDFLTQVPVGKESE